MNVSYYGIDLIFRIHEKRNSNFIKFERRSLLFRASSKREAYQQALIYASKKIEDRFGHNEIWEFLGLDNFQVIEQEQVFQESSRTIENTSEDAQRFERELKINYNSLQMELSKVS